MPALARTERAFVRAPDSMVECIDGLRTPVAARSACSGWTGQAIAASRGCILEPSSKDSQLPERLRVGETLKLYS